MIFLFQFGIWEFFGLDVACSWSSVGSAAIRGRFGDRD